ncbi:MAG: thiopurine S-methyltransferase [Alphaproteobacteria bacterium]|nr:thiopurine S-methyltransferase [Alphaproteobacteria bacterium]
MDPEFWHERWQNNQIGFHQDDTNKLLMKHWPRLSPDDTAQGEVFLPLCGKTNDIDWLCYQGGEHHVIGVELSPLAIRQFFEWRGHNLPSPERRGNFDVYLHGRWEFWCGDFFEFPKERLKNTKLCYDRAALIALPTQMRQRYAQKMCEILPEDAQTLLLTITYNPGEMDGPPFSVPDHEVQALFGPHRSVEHLESRDGLKGAEKLRERGLTALTTSVFQIGTARS